MHIFRYSERGAAVTARWQTGHRNALPYLWGATGVCAVLLVVLPFVGRQTHAGAITANITATVFAAVVCTVMKQRERETAKRLSGRGFLLLIEKEEILVADADRKEPLFRCTFQEIIRADMGEEIVRIATAYDGVCLPKDLVPPQLTDFMQRSDGCAVHKRSWM